MQNQSIEDVKRAIEERSRELKKKYNEEARFKILSDSKLCRLKLYLKFLKKHKT